MQLILFSQQHEYNNCQQYVPIDLANLLKVIASEVKQSDAKHRPEPSRGIPRLTRDDPLRRIRLLRRWVPRNDSLSEYIFYNRYIETNQPRFSFLIPGSIYSRLRFAP
jgi:hypothetical protein